MRENAAIRLSVAGIMRLLHVDQTIDFCNFTMRSIQSDVGVGVQCERHILVPQHFLNDLCGHTRFHGECYPSYLPDGLDVANVVSSFDESIIDFRDIHSGNIALTFIESGSSAESNIDTENAQTSMRIINGYQCHIVKKDASISVFWTDGKRFYLLICDGTNEDEVISIAEGVRRMTVCLNAVYELFSGIQPMQTVDEASYPKETELRFSIVYYLENDGITRTIKVSFYDYSDAVGIVILDSNESSESTLFSGFVLMDHANSIAFEKIYLDRVASLRRVPNWDNNEKLIP